MPILKIFICRQGGYFHWENDIILVLKIFWMSILFYFCLIILLNLKKNSKKGEKFTNFLKPQNKNGWPSGQNCKWIIIFDMCCCPFGYTKLISWYYSNIIVVQFAILNYIVVNDNNVIVLQLANSVHRANPFDSVVQW
jgi:hypothetical protein